MIWADKLFSDRAKNVKRSEIRELLKLTTKPGVISFAGGLPHPDTINQELMRTLVDHVVDQHDDTALQYGPTEGHPELIRELIKYHKAYDGIDVTAENILVTSAAQQAIELTAKAFLDAGDKVICERPTYLGFLQAARGFRGEFIGVDMDMADGIVIEQVEDALKNRNGRIKYIYLVPDFQNPAGVTTSLEKRKKLIELAREHGIVVVEDSPYRKLRYSGEDLPSMLSLDERRDTVVTLHTFSKIFAPGLRLGWVTGPVEIIEKLTILKQPADLCTSPFVQFLAGHYLGGGHLDKQLEFIVKFYRPKQEALLEAFERELGDIPGTHWTKPDGGMFSWLTFPKGIDATELFKVTIERNLAFVIGAAFDCYGERNEAGRINFSYPTIEQIHEGSKILGKCLKEMVAGKSGAAAG
ncbi:MAG: PLP-dependent aminotransferase family protein [bacterium]|jgi:2-aminoadipate transaminase